MKLLKQIWNYLINKNGRRKMSSITVDFKFEIEEVVYIKTALHAMDNRPNRYIVQERIAQQCHGGVQRMYKLVGMSEHLPELALTIKEPEYRPVGDNIIEEFIKLEERKKEFVQKIVNEQKQR